MVSLLSSKIGNPEGFAPSPSSGELPCAGKLHRMELPWSGFSDFCVLFYVLWNEGFYGGQSANPAPNLLIKILDKICPNKEVLLKKKKKTLLGQILKLKTLTVFSPSPQVHRFAVHGHFQQRNPRP